MQIGELSSGMMCDREAISNVSRVRGGTPVKLDRGLNKGTYVSVKNIQGRTLSKGMVVLGSYNAYNQGADLYEVLGFTSDEDKYGEGGVKFDSVKDLFKYYGVKSLRALEELQNQNTYGYSSYMMVRDLHDGDEGAWFYIFEGRWCRGSGAEPLSFTLMQKQ